MPVGEGADVSPGCAALPPEAVERMSEINEFAAQRYGPRPPRLRGGEAVIATAYRFGPSKNSAPALGLSQKRPRPALTSEDSA